MKGWSLGRWGCIGGTSAGFCGVGVLDFLDVFFFFSSRRRHTRLQGDWSSDVCSSDLSEPSGGRSAAVRRVPARLLLAALLPGGGVHGGDAPTGDPVLARGGRQRHPDRSEERRVGKEGRSRWSPYH